jgi:hypothetical protein
MSYDINILCNGNRCKQYLHKNRIFIEAKEGSEYAIEIKNNSWEKILAVVSVDGLNVVDGDPADDNGTGYVLDKYSAQKLYGFQYSKEKVAAFKFGAFGAVKLDPATGQPEIDPSTGKEIPLGYAASKGDGAEKNAGVIGVRIWDEIPQPPPPRPTGGLYGAGRYGYSISASYCGTSSYSISASYCGTSSYSIGTSIFGTGSSSWATQSRSSSYSPNPHDWMGQQLKSSTIDGNLLNEAIADAKAVRATALAGPKSADPTAFDQQGANYSSLFGGCAASAQSSIGVSTSIPNNAVLYCASVTVPETTLDMVSFDMETQWGEAKSYKVKEATFQRKDLVHSFDIYYASRESLVAMGVDIGTEKRVSFPESFRESKYAKPPKGWTA